MAVLSNNRLTLLDLAKRTDPDGGVAMIAEVLQQQNEILDDITFINGNLPTGHRTTIRTGLPEPTWRRLNEGVVPQASTTAQITFNTGMLEYMSEMDVELANLSDNPAAARFSEDVAAVQGINHELSTTLFYGNEEQDPAAFTGLSYYYNDKDAESGNNIIDAAGTSTNNASIWLVGWGENTIHGLVPKNSQAGMMVNDLGMETAENAGGTGKLLRVFRTQLQLKAGLAVRDWRYGIRVANINRANLNAGATGDSADLPDLMHSALVRVQSLSGVTPVFYMDRSVMEILQKQLASKVAASSLTSEDVGGRRTSMFQGIPVRKVDALATDEARVV